MKWTTKRKLKKEKWADKEDEKRKADRESSGINVCKNTPEWTDGRVLLVLGIGWTGSCCWKIDVK